jgi:hypothetical protein
MTVRAFHLLLMTLNHRLGSTLSFNCAVCVSVYDNNPPLAVVRKFVHLLDASDNDYAEELGK